MIQDATKKSKAVIMTAGRDVFGILGVLKNRDFRGNRGLAVKNSIYQFANNIVLKGGALIFTIIFARLLMPELFGLYSLALSTILIFAAFSDLGIGQAMILFVSKALNRKKDSLARAYFMYLLKIKLVLVFLSAAILLAVSGLIANNYYHKPIFFALLAGGLYLLSTGFIGVFDSLYQSTNQFKQMFLRESLFQVLRLCIVPIMTIYFIKSASTEFILFWIIIALSISYFAALLFMFISAIKDIQFFKAKPETLTNSEKKSVKQFLILMSSTILSGMFIGYIDTIMLGRFVAAEYIGFYTAALNLVNSLSPLIPVSAVLFPIFSRLSGEKLERGFKKSIRVTFLLSIGLLIVTLLFAPLAINLIYGSNYALSVNLLRVLAITVLVLPVSALYDSYFISVGKPQTIAKLLLYSTLVNVVLNYLLISYLLRYSPYLAAIGSATAVLITRILYLSMAIIAKRKLVSSQNKKVN